MAITDGNGSTITPLGGWRILSNSTPRKTINLGDAPAAGRKVVVVDAVGDAASNNITINAGSGQQIDGADSLTISTNSQRKVLKSTGSGWNVVTTTSDSTFGSTGSSIDTETDWYASHGSAGNVRRLVFKKENLTNNSAVSMFDVTIPNGDHSCGIRVFCHAANADNTRSVTFEHMFSITRTEDSAIGVTFPSGNPSTLTGEATSGTGNPDFTIAGAHTKSGGASATNTFVYTININGDSSNGADVVVVAEMINMNSSGITMAES